MEKSLLKIKILTPDKIVYDQTGISEITLPTTSGEITVLPNHIPLVSVVKTGEIRLVKDGMKIAIAISRGILEVRPDSEMVILAERSELAEEIDLARAEEAYKRAADIAKAEKNAMDVDDARFEAMVEKELNRINIAKRWR